eukprot:7435985-Ditylum_brightwellii.AAC.1
MPEWDVIAQIIAAICESNLKGEFEHVKEHQDKDKKYGDLLLPAQLNVNVDILAVAFQSQNTKRDPQFKLPKRVTNILLRAVHKEMQHLLHGCNAANNCFKYKILTQVQ